MQINENAIIFVTRNSDKDDRIRIQLRYIKDMQRRDKSNICSK